MLLFGTKAHHVFHPCAVVPTSIKNHDLARGGQMRHVTLHVHLSFFAVRRSGESDNAKHPRAHALGNRANRTALSRAITPLEEDDDPKSLGLHPVLELAQLRLELAELLFILLAPELRFSVLCRFLLFRRNLPSDLFFREPPRLSQSDGKLRT